MILSWLLFAWGVCSTMYLRGVEYPIGGAFTSEPLRGIRKGDIWAPAQKGSNILPCGSFGTNSFLGTRMTIERGRPFLINGTVPLSAGGGVLTFEVVFDKAKPNFNLDISEELGELHVPDTSHKYDWSAELTLPTDALAGPFTVQVKYNALEADHPYYQCVDLASEETITTESYVVFFIVIITTVCALCLFSVWCYRRSKAKRRAQIAKTFENDSHKYPSRAEDERLQRAAVEQPDISNLHSLQSITQSLKGELNKTPKIERLHAAQHAGSISDQSESDTDTELSGNECQVEVINTAQMRDPSETVDLGLSNDWANNDYGKQLKKKMAKAASAPSGAATLASFIDEEEEYSDDKLESSVSQSDTSKTRDTSRSTSYARRERLALKAVAPPLLRHTPGNRLQSGGDSFRNFAAAGSPASSMFGLSYPAIPSPPGHQEHSFSASPSFGQSRPLDSQGAANNRI